MALALSGAAGTALGVWSTAAVGDSGLQNNGTKEKRPFNYSGAATVPELLPSEIESKGYPAVYDLYENLWGKAVGDGTDWDRIKQSRNEDAEKEWFGSRAPALLLKEQNAFYLDALRGRNGMLQSSTNVVWTNEGISKWKTESAWERARGSTDDRPGQSMSFEARSLETSVNVAVGTDLYLARIIKTSSFPDYLEDGKTPALLSKMISSKKEVPSSARRPYEKNDFTNIRKIASLVKVYPGITIGEKPITLSEAIPKFEYTLRKGKKFDVLGGLYNLRSMILNSIQYTALVAFGSDNEADEAKKSLLGSLTLRNEGAYDPRGYKVLEDNILVALVQYINDAFDFAAKNIGDALNRTLQPNYTIPFSGKDFANMIGFAGDQEMADGVEGLVQKMEQRKDLSKFANGPIILYGAGLFTAILTYTLELLSDFSPLLPEMPHYQGYYVLPEEIKKFPGSPGSNFKKTKVQLQEMKNWTEMSYLNKEEEKSLGWRTEAKIKQFNALIKVGVKKAYKPVPYGFGSHEYFDYEKFWDATKWACNSYGLPVVRNGNYIFEGNSKEKYGGCIMHYSDEDEDPNRLPNLPNEFSRLLGYLHNIQKTVFAAVGKVNYADYERQVIPLFVSSGRGSSFTDEFAVEKAYDFLGSAYSYWASTVSATAGFIVSLFFEIFKPPEIFTQVFSQELGGVTFKRFGETHIVRRILGFSVSEQVLAPFQETELMDPVELYSKKGSSNASFFFPNVRGGVMTFSTPEAVGGAYAEMLKDLYSFKTTGTV